MFACENHTSLGFKTLTGKLEATYRLPQGYSLTGGIERSNQDRRIPVGNIDSVTGRDFQRYTPWRSKLDETTVRAQVRRSFSDTLNGTLAYLHSKRSGSSYTLAAEAEPDLVNPIDIADRKRDKWRVVLDWAASDQLSLTLNLEDSTDKYANSVDRPLGLRDGKASMYSIDASYAFTSRWQGTAWYANDKTKATQYNVDDRVAWLEDTGDTVGVGLKGVLTQRINVGLDLLHSKNVNKYPEDVPGGYNSNSDGPLPDITSKLTRVKLFATYALQKNADLRFDYIHERWETNDWSYQFFDGTTFTYGTTTDGTQVTQNPIQSADFVGVRYIYRFQ